MKFIILMLILFIFSCNSSKKNHLNLTEEKVKVADSLKYYMDLNDYDHAILMFSSIQQPHINRIKKDKKKFHIWCQLWTLDSMSFKQFKEEISENKINFIFENGILKINDR